MKKIAIIGGGFSGLSLAWALSKNGLNCEIFESQLQTGGLISTKKDQILIESAANAVIASAHFEELLSDLKITPVKAGFKSNKRWLYRGLPKQFPLNFSETLKSAFNFLVHWVKSQHKPLENENLQDWSERVLSKEFCEFIISPAVQGIYATSAKNLSAELILGHFFNPELKIKKNLYRGSISAPHGMGQIINELTQYLTNKGVIIHYQNKLNLKSISDDFNIRVVATSLKDAPEVIDSMAPQAQDQLKKIPLLGINTVIMGFKNTRLLKGFGCLFPRNQKINALGVLFNSDIFENRGMLESETWIYDGDECDRTQSELINLALKDREHLLNLKEAPEVVQTRQWKQALPLYGTELKNIFKSDIWKNSSHLDIFDPFLNCAQLAECQQPTFLTGNYLGGIGLAKILDYNLRLTQKIKSIHL